MEKFNVLVLEDNLERKLQFIERFQEHSFCSDIVETAIDCINRLKTCKYDVVFLDHDLGGQIHVDVNDKNTGSEVARFWDSPENLNKNALVIIHSHNSVAAKHMKNIITNSILLPSIWLKEEFEKNIVINN